MAVVSAGDDAARQAELRRVVAENQQLYEAHEQVDQTRMSKDHVYAMLFARDDQWRLGHYTSMANKLLESLHVEPGDPRSYVAQAVALLFRIGRFRLDDDDDKCPSPVAGRAPELTENDEYNAHMWNALAPAIIMYVRGTKESPISASSEESCKRQKTAQDAFLFFNMNLSTWFTEWLCGDPTNRDAPPVLNRQLILQFIRGSLHSKMQVLVNGVTSSIEHFVAECISEYIAIVGVYNPIDERNQIHDYNPVPRLVD